MLNIVVAELGDVHCCRIFLRKGSERARNLTVAYEKETARKNRALKIDTTYRVSHDSIATRSKILTISINARVTVSCFLPSSSLNCIRTVERAIPRFLLRFLVHRVWQWSFLQDSQILHVLQESLVMLSDQKWIHSLHVLLKLLHVPLELRPPVLEPRDHLGIAETELSRDLIPVGRAQVLLIQKSLLQLENLLIREGGPALALLLRLLTVVE